MRGGGARVMVAEGALAGVAEVYGLHNWPGFPKGQVHVKAGAMLAQVHILTLTITGKGGHASQPQMCRDPIVAGQHHSGLVAGPLPGFTWAVEMPRAFHAQMGVQGLTCGEPGPELPPRGHRAGDGAAAGGRGWDGA